MLFRSFQIVLIIAIFTRTDSFRSSFASSHLKRHDTPMKLCDTSSNHNTEPEQATDKDLQQYFDRKEYQSCYQLLKRNPLLSLNLQDAQVRSHILFSRYS